MERGFVVTVMLILTVAMFAGSINDGLDGNVVYRGITPCYYYIGTFEFNDNLYFERPPNYDSCYNPNLNPSSQKPFNWIGSNTITDLNNPGDWVKLKINKNELEFLNNDPLIYLFYQ